MDELTAHYNKFNEDKRLMRRHGQVEYITVEGKDSLDADGQQVYATEKEEKMVDNRDELYKQQCEIKYSQSPYSITKEEELRTLPSLVPL